MGTRQETALILGGGGPVGIAWECGVLLGLRDRGVDLSQAGRIVGTSAGSIVGTHLAVAGSVEELYTTQKDPIDGGKKPSGMAGLMTAMLMAKLFHRTVEGQRRAIGRRALRAGVPGESAWLAWIAGFLPGGAEGRWPERDLCLTSVDVASGELKVWTRDSGVPLALAVASSCAVPCVFPLVHLEDRTYMDGGMGSPTNAVLGQNFRTVVILDPIARVLGRQSLLEREAEQLTAQGSTVVPLAFDDRVHALVGRNLMDASRRQRIAELGREQGRGVAESHRGLLAG